MQKKKNIHGILGLVILVISELLMLKGIEPFASWFYLLAWWSYILIVDSLIYRIKNATNGTIPTMRKTPTMNQNLRQPKKFQIMRHRRHLR